MERIAKFEKVSLQQFTEDWLRLFPDTPEERIREIHENIKLPKRATAGSAGYDFYAPVSFDLAAGEEILIPTGIRAKMDSSYVLVIVPRSSLGFKYRLQLDNTAGIIDSDYYNARNEGHMMCKLINDSRENRTLHLQAHDAMVQGLFLPFGITVDDDAQEQRTGGFGSTTENSKLERTE